MINWVKWAKNDKIAKKGFSSKIIPYYLIHIFTQLRSIFLKKGMSGLFCQKIPQKGPKK